mgnify:CR=1 FL=1
MVYASFSEMLSKVNRVERVIISVASACDEEVLEAVKYADEHDLAGAILIGDQVKLKEMAAKLNMDLGRFSVIHEPDPIKASLEATRQVSTGQADFLMKGQVNTSDFLRAVLDAEVGLRTGKVLSHLAAFEVPGYNRLLFVTDGGINIAPDFNEKVAIIQNAVNYLNLIGYENPFVAVLSANEAINPKMPVTMEAATLAKMAEQGQIKGCTLDGPLSLDLAISEEAAKHKSVTSPVAGKADLLMVPTIEVGNILGKAMVYLGKAKMAGIVLGAKVPVVLTSRAATMETKVTSIVMAALAKSKKH